MAKKTTNGILPTMTLYQYRDNRGISQYDLADLLGVKQATVSRLEAEDRTASLILALEIERRTGGEVEAEHLPITPRTRRAIRRLRSQMRALKAS